MREQCGKRPAEPAKVRSGSKAGTPTAEAVKVGKSGRGQGDAGTCIWAVNGGDEE